MPLKIAEKLGKSEKAYQKREDKVIKGLNEIKDTTEKTSVTSEKTLKNTEELKSILNKQFEHLLQLDENMKLNKDSIISAVQEISDKQKEAVFNDILDALTEPHLQMKDELREILTSLRNPGGNLEMKIKTSIPLLNLLGLDIGVEGSFDIKSWSKKMYEKHELKLFRVC